MLSKENCTHPSTRVPFTGQCVCLSFLSCRLDKRKKSWRKCSSSPSSTFVWLTKIAKHKKDIFAWPKRGRPTRGFSIVVRPSTSTFIWIKNNGKIQKRICSKLYPLQTPFSAPPVFLDTFQKVTIQFSKLCSRTNKYFHLVRSFY